MMVDRADEQGVGGTGGSAGPTRKYLCPDPDQIGLVPVSIADVLGPDHLVWFVRRVVGEFDTRALHTRPRGCRGARPYLPEMMLGLVLYAYCCGIRSSRQIESACCTDLAFWAICGTLRPDHSTFARFVACHEHALEDLFVEGVRLCAEAGLTDLSVLALDGTKIAANASAARNRDVAWIRKEIALLMAATAAEDPDDDHGPGPGLEPGPGVQTVLDGCQPRETSSRRVSVKERALRDALARAEAEDAATARARERAARVSAERVSKGHRQKGRKPRDPQRALARAESDVAAATECLATLQAEQDRRSAAQARGEAVTGKRLRIDRATQALTRAQDTLTAARQAAANAAPVVNGRANVTDPDSRIMSTQKGWVQGYNCQAIANQRQIVVACHVSQNAGDVQLYEPMSTLLTSTLIRAGITVELALILILADAGYCSEHNLTLTGADRLIATRKDWQQRRAAREHGTTNGPPPPDATPVEEMEHLMRTPQGTAAYAQRAQIIEPVFGQHKHNHHFRSFRRRGLAAATSEWAFINLARNMLKLREHRAAPTPA
jgi:transposase